MNEVVAAIAVATFFVVNFQLTPLLGRCYNILKLGEREEQV